MTSALSPKRVTAHRADGTTYETTVWVADRPQVAAGHISVGGPSSATGGSSQARHEESVAATEVAVRDAVSNHLHEVRRITESGSGPSVLTTAITLRQHQGPNGEPTEEDPYMWVHVQTDTRALRDHRAFDSYMQRQGLSGVELGTDTVVMVHSADRWDRIPKVKGFRQYSLERTDDEAISDRVFNYVDPVADEGFTVQDTLQADSYRSYVNAGQTGIKHMRDYKSYNGAFVEQWADAREERGLSMD